MMMSHDRRSSRVYRLGVPIVWSVGAVALLAFVGVAILIGTLTTKQASRPIELMSVERQMDAMEKRAPAKQNTQDATEFAARLLDSATVTSETPVPQLEKPRRIVETPVKKQAQIVAAQPKPKALMFDGRPLKRVRTIQMLVTAYSPDERSCGKSADGITASGYSVWTNGMNMVAADARVFGFGSVISVPGYNSAKPVPVLDRGGKIKGNHIDVLFPTDEEAREWGTKRLTITVYDYAD